jgi:putative transposon-encoded protein
MYMAGYQKKLALQLLERNIEFDARIRKQGTSYVVTIPKDLIKCKVLLVGETLKITASQESVRTRNEQAQAVSYWPIDSNGRAAPERAVQVPMADDEIEKYDNSLEEEEEEIALDDLEEKKSGHLGIRPHDLLSGLQTASNAFSGCLA